MYWDYIQLVNKNISGEIAKENIMKISQYHRIQASKWFHDAITFLVEEIKKIGLSPEVHKFKADGEIKYYRWDWDNDGIWDTDWLDSSTVENTYYDAGS
ncbi:MAG: hypothetical protein ACTSSP_13005, partial [Candidatus Asgardarchaeia archaeon]